ncbi:MAG: hypothetical protein RIS47_604 [Bacteroidota bacterium]
MGILAEWGYVGLFFASFLAATVVPIGSETLVTAMLLGNYNFWWVIIIATIGNWFGGMSGYFLGYSGRWDWIERILRIKKEKVERFGGRVRRNGVVLALLCWLPAIGDFLAIALGIFKANWRFVAILMFAGKFVRFVLWGYLTVWVWNQVH